MNRIELILTSDKSQTARAFLGAALATLSWYYVDTIFAIRCQYTLGMLDQVTFRYISAHWHQPPFTRHPYNLLP